MNVLLVGSGDPRHILKTIAGLQDKQSVHVSLSLFKLQMANNTLSYKELLFATLQIWVIENNMEVVARQLLLLYLALIPQDSMGINGTWELDKLFILLKQDVLLSINQWGF